MLCEKCGQRPATTHVCSIISGQMKTSDLCSECGKDAAGDVENINISEFQRTLMRKSLEPITAKDDRYNAMVYAFVMEAVTFAKIMKTECGSVSTVDNISAGQLLEVLRVLALLRFGHGTKARLSEWGVRRCEDFGEIIFNLVEAGLLGKSPEDRKEDFQGGYDFDVAFPEN
jgi:uncharacterized repeat protein (TIGR04138 family)